MLTLAALSVGGLLPLLIQIIVVAVVFWLVNWAIGYIGIADPFAKIIRVVMALIALIYLVNLLLSLTGNGFLTR